MEENELNKLRYPVGKFSAPKRNYSRTYKKLHKNYRRSSGKISKGRTGFK